MSAHESEWTLRRLRAGELASPEAHRVRAHAAGCVTCGAVLKGLEEHQARFEAEHPFERFEAGVERALERQQQQRAPRPPPRRWVPATVALAASLLVVVLAKPLLEQGPEWNRRKGGGDAAELRIGGGTGPQREARPDRPEALEPGERVMLGYKAGAHRYMAAVSVDAIGEVTALHPESGASVAVEPGTEVHWLEGSWEFTGSGVERVVLVLGDEPFAVESLVEATRRAFAAAGGEVERMAPLDVKGAQTHWVLLKP
ncbi:ACP synthase [Myxococcus sp. AS-1-15]|uniref:ACP synthase n=1 Tax=Myxococcus sp. AS-1-15 TaxID=2874600 RepID=UPI001CBEE85E|nr:ACP synthase [Myxococcus sp. AS-1-15]MBZ4398946.1 ACP synthase [Myxococcus sp. AS-1-15]